MKIDILIKGGKTVDKSIIDIAILDDKIMILSIRQIKL